MNRQVGGVLVIVGCLALVGVGALIDATGGVTIRTNIAPDITGLTVFDPLLPGTHVKPSWTVTKGVANREVELVLVTEEKEYSLARTKFNVGSGLIVIPCELAGGNVRIELIGQQDRDVISSIEVEVLPPGPDCVR